jgi:hypothetical protein
MRVTYPALDFSWASFGGATLICNLGTYSTTHPLHYFSDLMIRSLHYATICQLHNSSLFASSMNVYSCGAFIKARCDLYPLQDQWRSVGGTIPSVGPPS